MANLKDISRPNVHKHRLAPGYRKLGKEAYDTASKGEVLTLHEQRDAFTGEYGQELLKGLELNSKVEPRFWLLMVKRCDHTLNNVYRITTIGCRVRPQAEPGTDCWFVDVDKQVMELVWVLPTRPAILQMAAGSVPDADPFLVSCCKEYLDGRLNAEYNRIAASGATADSAASADRAADELEGDERNAEKADRRK